MRTAATSMVTPNPIKSNTSSSIFYPLSLMAFFCHQARALPVPDHLDQRIALTAANLVALKATFLPVQGNPATSLLLGDLRGFQLCYDGVILWKELTGGR